MAIDILKARGQSLEEEYFARLNHELANKLKVQGTRADAKIELAQISGIKNESFLEALVDSNVSPAALQAMFLLPLVRIAWADGTLDPKEKEAILEAAKDQGIDATHPSYSALDSWLNVAPGDTLFEAWQGYIRELRASMSEDTFQDLRRGMLNRTQAVARAAGGFLGFAGKMSAAEKDELNRIEEAFQVS